MNDVDIDTLRRLLVEARTTIDELSADNYALRCELVRYRSEDEARRRHPSSVSPTCEMCRGTRLILTESTMPTADMWTRCPKCQDDCPPHGIRRPTLHLIGGEK
jgi:hypothetical protein